MNWRMHWLHLRTHSLFVSGRVYRDDEGEMFQPVAIELTDGQSAVLIAWEFGSRPPR